MRKLLFSLLILSSTTCFSAEQSSPNIILAKAGFSCGQCRTSCRRIGSCKLANFCLQRCRKKSFDRDRDNIPCENVCGKTQSQFKRRLNK